MNLFDKINISLNYSPYLFVIGAIIVVLYTIFIYRITLPKISTFGKSILIFVRTLSLLFILFLLFDPVIKLTSTETVYPENFVFIDNSKSISKFSSEKQITELKNLISNLSEDLEGETKFFTFGKDVKKVDIKNLDSLHFNNTSTNFSSIFSFIREKTNLAGIVIISDGINNEGKNPIYETENLSAPIFTVGIGDTSVNSDVYVYGIHNNKFIYTGRETEIEVTIGNIELTNKEVTVGLYENNQLISSKKIKLSSAGINRLRFSYSSKLEGEHKLTVKITNNFDEQNKNNNRKSTLINILSTKKKIAVIAGTPSPDLAAVKNSLMRNEDFEINSIIQISDSKYYNDLKNLEILTSSDAILLIGFPTLNSEPAIIKKIIKEIEDNNKPVFLIFSNTVNFNRLKEFKDILPFKISNISDKFIETQISVVNGTNGILSKTETDLNYWEELPPVYLSKTKITPSINSFVLLSGKRNSNSPILFSSNTAGRKTIILTPSDFWKWKLRPRSNSNFYFDNFLLNAIKWLTLTSEAEFFNVTTDKKSYKLGETITITANLLDETYEPINNADISLTTNNNDQAKFSSLGNGFYKAEIKVTEPGLYEYSAKVNSPKLNINEITGKINVEEIELELIQSKMNKLLLQSLAKKNKGIYLNIDNYTGLINKINENYNSKISYKLLDNELRLSNFEFILIFIVLFLSIEWIIRKAYRML